MSNPMLSTGFDHAIGELGLLLVLVVVVMAEHGYSAHQRFAGRVGAFIARRAIDGVAVVGWLVDRLPRPAAANGGMR
jgi:hypothetical protein